LASEERRRSVFQVGIGPSAIADHGTDPALHEDLLEDLMIHGQLVFSSEEHLDSFVAAVRDLPPSLAKAWETVLASRRITVGIANPAHEPTLDELLDPAALDENYSNTVQLVLVESTQAELLGVPREEFSAQSPGGLVEVGRITTASRTATVMAARQIMAAPLRPGTSREEEWKERLQPLVASTRPVVIYDKYAGVQAARRPAPRRRTDLAVAPHQHHQRPKGSHHYRGAVQIRTSRTHGRRNRATGPGLAEEVAEEPTQTGSGAGAGTHQNRRPHRTIRP